MNVKSNTSKIFIVVISLLCLSIIYISLRNETKILNTTPSNETENLNATSNNETESLNVTPNNETESLNSTPHIETITFPSLDELDITADLYLIDSTSPIVLLFHQAKSSRGEYLEIAPKLNDLGYNAMAIDARRGFSNTDINNETAERAREKGLIPTYLDALADLEAAIQYAEEELNYDNIITWGSSYSASLVVAFSQKHSDTVKAVLAFSPGEYFWIEDKTIAEYAKELNLPTFITGAKREKEEYNLIFEAIASDYKICFEPDASGAHGSYALLERTQGHEEYWDAVKDFLDNLE
ncbi:alpha/beta hydrolase [Vallitalea okinawensis]|uniref:alpha/beta hydrolase n=1 Tax=Vallitalea okinawensis TaxID=2078660 RepID=UPI001300B8E3|nr:alpha/beta hydrolase [Vallitalea okinawensis]